MSWGGERCDFDWGKPLSKEEVRMVADKKAELGTSAMRDFNFHTAHIYFSVADELRKHFPEESKEKKEKAVTDYIALFGQEAYDTLLEFSPDEF